MKNIEIEEYIEYIRSFEDKTINEKINLYREKHIDFEELEMVCIENDMLSIRTYFKTFKLGSL